MIEAVPNLTKKCVRSCVTLSDERLIYAGHDFIELYSLELKKVVKSIFINLDCRNILVSPDEQFLFLATNSGLKQFSLLDLLYLRTHRPSSNVQCIAILNIKNRILFNDNERVICLDLYRVSLIDFIGHKKGYIQSIASTNDETFFFTTGTDNTLKRWCTHPWRVINSIQLSYSGCSLFVNEEAKSILVGMGDGKIAAYSIHDLCHLNTISLHNNSVTKIIRLRFGNLVTCSHDGDIKFPYSSKKSIDASKNWIYSIAQLNNNSLACACQDGLKIVQLPSFKNDCDDIIDSIKSNMFSISISAAPRKPQLISLLQHHLSQLISKTSFDPIGFSGRVVSFLPDFNSLERSNFVNGNLEGRKKTFTKFYSHSLNIIKFKSVFSDDLLFHFQRKLRLLGTATNNEDPLNGFKIKQVRKGKWIFTMDQETILDKNDIFGPASAVFSNGSLKCYISDGELVMKKDFQIKLEVNGEVMDVHSVGNDDLVITSQQKLFKLNFKTYRIENLNT